MYFDKVLDKGYSKIPNNIVELYYDFLIKYLKSFIIDDECVDLMLINLRNCVINFENRCLVFIYVHIFFLY